MFTSLVYYYVLLPTLPLERKKCPTVVGTCLDLLRWGNFISGFLSMCRWRFVRVGRWTRISLGEWSEKFFNRSPITLKFEAEKLERESQERERARARERKRERERERDRKRAICHLTVVSCYSIFVSWHSILVICYFTCKL